MEQDVERLRGVFALLHLEAQRDDDVDAHPTYCVRAKVRDFNWRVSQLRFVALQELFDSLLRLGFSPQAPFPKRQRREVIGLRLSPDSVEQRAAALRDWFEEVGALARECADRDADAMLALAAFLRVGDVETQIRDAMAKDEGPQLQPPPDELTWAQPEPELTWGLPEPLSPRDKAQLAFSPSGTEAPGLARTQSTVRETLDLDLRCDVDLEGVQEKLSRLRAKQKRRQKWTAKSSRRSLSLKPQPEEEDDDEVAEATEPRRKRSGSSALAQLMGEEDDGTTALQDAEAPPAAFPRAVREDVVFEPASPSPAPERGAPEARGEDVTNVPAFDETDETVAPVVQAAPSPAVDAATTVVDTPPLPFVDASPSPVVDATPPMPAVDAPATSSVVDGPATPVVQAAPTPAVDAPATVLDAPATPVLDAPATPVVQPAPTLAVPPAPTPVFNAAPSSVKERPGVKSTDLVDAAPTWMVDALAALAVQLAPPPVDAAPTPAVDAVPTPVVVDAPAAAAVALPPPAAADVERATSERGAIQDAQSAPVGTAAFTPPTTPAAATLAPPTPDWTVTSPTSPDAFETDAYLIRPAYPGPARRPPVKPNMFDDASAWATDWLLGPAASPPRPRPPPAGAAAVRRPNSPPARSALVFASGSLFNDAEPPPLWRAPSMNHGDGFRVEETDNVVFLSRAPWMPPRRRGEF